MTAPKKKANKKPDALPAVDWLNEIDIAEDEDESEEGWTTIIDFTKIRKGGVPIDEVRAAMKRIQAEREGKS